MKNLLGFVLLSVVCSQNLFGQSNVHFEISDLPDSSVIVGYHYGDKQFVVDTLKVKDGQFNFKSTDEKQGLYFVYSPQFYLEFILDTGNFELRTSRAGGYGSLEVSGSTENSGFRDFQLKMGALQKNQRAMLAELQGASKTDSSQIIDQLQRLESTLRRTRDSISGVYEGTFLHAFLQLTKEIPAPNLDTISDINERRKQAYFYQKVHYFDYLDWRDDRLLRTPVIHQKVMAYFDQYVVQIPDSINAEIDQILNPLRNDPGPFRYWLVTFFKRYRESKIMGMDGVTTHLIENYFLKKEADWISEEYEKMLREELAYTKNSLIGKKAPPLNVVDTLNQPFSLSDLSAKYVLVFIYDPDCGHCKKAVKTLEQKDKKLLDLGIEVVAVCTTTNMERWKQFVQSHNPMWHHVIDPTGQSYFRVYYDVRSTPRIYLLDRERKIIAKKISIEQMIDLVEKRG